MVTEQKAAEKCNVFCGFLMIVDPLWSFVMLPCGPLVVPSGFLAVFCHSDFWTWYLSTMSLYYVSFG